MCRNKFAKQTSTKTVSVFLLFLVFVAFQGCAANDKIITFNELPKDKDSLDIHEGILCNHAQKIKYKQQGKIVAEIELSEPVMVAQAEQKENWGFFQFPSINISDDNSLIVSWSMKGDTYKMYGKKAERREPQMVSKDGGKTWNLKEKNYTIRNEINNPQLRDGSILTVVTPAVKDIRSYKDFPPTVGNNGNYSFYLMDNLPDELQGIYVRKTGKNNKTQTIHAQINDNKLLRYAIDSLMPIVWWGNIRYLSDNSLVAGVYPCYYLDTPGGVAHSGVSFYKSRDEGLTWDRLSRISFKQDGIAENREGTSFEEPAFEILADSTFICVMRSGSKSPMYQTFSSDRGTTWTDPQPITPNGVKPKLLRLKNGVLVLASGRPGVQIRFNLDGTGRQWTEPIDMIAFMGPDGKPSFWGTCGYASIIEADDNSFYIVYSDFNTKNNLGQLRKAIFCRKVTIKNRL